MHKNGFETQVQQPVTTEQFNQFKKEIAVQINHLRVILDIQHKQINLLTESRQETSRQIQESSKRNQEMYMENELLKIKIESLEATLHALHSDINQLKKDFQQQKNPLKMSPQLDSNCLLHHQKQNRKKQDPFSQSQGYQQKSSLTDSSSKYTVENRKTTDIEDALDDDDQEEIECVWYTNEKKIAQNIEHHHQNPHSKQFSTQRKNNFLSITKNNGCGFLSPAHSFIHKDCIPFSKISKFSVKKIKIRDIFLIGIGTMNIFGVQNAFRHRQLAAYSSNGYIWLNGDSSKCSNELKLNQTIDMIVDRAKGTISWSIDNIQMTKSHIPHQIINKQLYLVIMMFNKEDTLHLYHNP